MLHLLFRVWPMWNSLLLYGVVSIGISPSKKSHTFYVRYLVYLSWPFPTLISKSQTWLWRVRIWTKFVEISEKFPWVKALSPSLDVTISSMFKILFSKRNAQFNSIDNEHVMENKNLDNVILAQHLQLCNRSMYLKNDLILVLWFLGYTLQLC